MNSRRRVVVTGYGMMTPLGSTAKETFDRCSKGESGIDYITSFDVHGFPCQIGGQIDDRWIKQDVLPESWKSSRKFSRGVRLMYLAVKEAVRQAKLPEVYDRNRIGVALGTNGKETDLVDIAALQKAFDKHGKKWDLQRLKQEGGYDFLQFYRRKPDIASAIISRLFDCRGSNLSIASACAAGTQAIGEASRVIQDDKCDIVIAGGCETTLSLTGLMGFLLLGALSERYAEPTKASRPFDRKRNGFVLSEGGAAVILEEYAHASRRGATIYGEILGYGASTDAYRITDTHPRGDGAVLAMRNAIEDASLEPEDIEYINAHGTSTLKNDFCETKAIKEVFGRKAPEIPISSNKSMLGHSIAAAGPIEMILTLMGMDRSTILPTINQEFSDPKCDLWYVPNRSIQNRHSIALSNSFAFGGQNACLCIGKVS